MVLAESVNDTPKLKGNRSAYENACPVCPSHVIMHVCVCHRYKVSVEVPVQKALFRVLPSSLQQGKEIIVFVVLFTQGINEQQSIADKSVSSLPLMWACLSHAHPSLVLFVQVW